MARATLAALALVSATAFAQTATPSTAPAAESLPPQLTPSQMDEVRKEVDARVEAVKKELRDEMRAQQATQAAAQGWQDEWVQEKRKLELVTLDGYFRVRPDLFNKFDMGREPDSTGQYLFPRSPISLRERTEAGANMRLRLEPTINVSEQVRVHMQIDALDNVVLGSSPEYILTRPGVQNLVQFSTFNVGQIPPTFGVAGSLTNSIAVKRAYGEVTTPVGILRFGRMGEHWGLGMLHNDGTCLDCDYGDTVDRIQFVANPFPGWYIAPMLDFNLEGPLATAGNPGQPFDLTQSDDSHSYVVAIAKRDTDQEARAKLDNGQAVFNFGLHFEYRSQRMDPLGWLNNSINNALLGSGQFADPTVNPNLPISNEFVPRNSQLFIPDLWAKYERKNWRIEVELAGVFGTIGNRNLSTVGNNWDPAVSPGLTQSLSITQFGGVLQGDYKFLEGKLKVGGEVGFASGDSAPGLGNKPGQGNPNSLAQGNVINQSQFGCQSASALTANNCDFKINNFIFNRDYRIDSILWREILGPVTDAVYVKPQISYDVTEGLMVWGDVVYSRTVFQESSPNGTNPDLGIELEAGARYESEDGFIAGVSYGIVIPMGGLQSPSATATSLENAQALRGWLGIKF